MQRTKRQNKQKKPKTGKSKKTTIAPLAVAQSAQLTMPSFSIPRTNGGSIRVQRTEFVGTFTNSAVTGYSLLPPSAQTPGLDLNPGCGTLFPWLSGIAERFERFKFHSLSFVVVPSQSANTAGRFYLAVDYDWDDAVAANKAALMGNRTVAEGPVWTSVRLSCDTRALHPDMQEKYVSVASRENHIEPRTSYCGFLMAAVDTPTANLSFDLSVTYDITLTLPVADMFQGIDSFPSATTPVAANIINYPYAAGILCRKVADDMVLPVSQLVKGAIIGSDCPQLLLGGSTTYPVGLGSRALDLSKLAGKDGSFSWRSYLTATGVTPSTLAATDALRPVTQFFNSLGTYIATFTPTSVVSGFASALDLGFGAAVTAAGSPVNAVSKWSLKDLFNTYPDVRYAVPLLIATTGEAGAGTVAGGVSLNL